MKNHELLKAAYAAFNRRDIDAALAVMHPQVEWANGMEGGTVRGHLAVREYWTRQWGVINPRVEPLNFAEDETGRVMVKVHLVVRDLKGTVIADRIVYHAYAFEGELVKSMEIKEPGK
jgi:ketosteroid isomerase-like protein